MKECDMARAIVDSLDRSERASVLEEGDLDAVLGARGEHELSDRVLVIAERELVEANGGTYPSWQTDLLGPDPREGGAG